jgi:hypothetical protein
MRQVTLKKRVEKLERRVGQMQSSGVEAPGRDDWQSTIGMFAGDAVAKEVIDGALRERRRERKRECKRVKR